MTLSATPKLARAADERVDWIHNLPFIAVHFVPLFALITGVKPFDVALCVALYVARMFFITAGYHRYFSHRAYKMGRGMQFLMAFGGATAAQKGPLWWAAHHRHHHRFSDTQEDIHSPLKGFWWSHVGWIICRKYQPTDLDAIKDFAKYPELRWLNKHYMVPPTLLGVACFLAGGWSALVIGFFLSTVLTYHGTFFINSLAHVIGRRRYATRDTSRNSFLLALITLGEGWHNNHHHYMSTANQGFYWWEIDISYYALRLLSLVGLVRDLRTPSARIMELRRIADGQPDDHAPGAGDDAEAMPSVVAPV
ncbi:MAG TPA: acyl-CoA desaturase [Polyangiales bacterium]|jgi:stearoyl-CoA desaturase (delta-9 desaturase)|nr:acyl-CoA desaturase [Polyangiales bacterium]